jgi:hypothetical protein
MKRRSLVKLGLEALIVRESFSEFQVQFVGSLYKHCERHEATSIEQFAKREPARASEKLTAAFQQQSSDEEVTHRNIKE